MYRPLITPASLLALLTLWFSASAEEHGSQIGASVTANFLGGSADASLTWHATPQPHIQFYTTLPELGGSERVQTPILSLFYTELYGGVQVPERALIFVHFPATEEQPANNLPRFLLDRIVPGPPFTYHFVTFSLTSSQTNLLMQGKAEIVVVTEDTGAVFEGPLLPLDTDYDGIPDFRDQCPDTQANVPVNSDGCSIDQLCPCAGSWKNHGEYMRQMLSVLLTFRRDGLITSREGLSIFKHAVDSDCGKHSNGRNPGSRGTVVRN